MSKVQCINTLPSREELAAARAEALAMVSIQNVKEVLAVVTAGNKKENWPVRIEKRSGYFSINGRWTGLDVYLFETPFGYLLSVTNFNRCGHVPAQCTASDIQSYISIKNKADASTLAAGVKWLIENGYAFKHPPQENDNSTPITPVDHCQSCGRDFQLGEIVYYAPMDNNIICNKCAEVHSYTETRRYRP